VRAVLDVNILISALLFRRGTPAHLLMRWLAGEFELVASDALLADLERALAYPKLRSRVPPPEAKRFVAVLRRMAPVVADPPAPPARSADPGDGYLLALAAYASAILVSGDRHLLDLSEQLPVRSAQQFMQLLSEAAETERH
jgi:putative PIN family toxin of toxin-antitoxin system